MSVNDSLSLKQLTKGKIVLILFFCICLYLVFVSFSIHQITVADEVICLNGAKTITTGGIPRDLDGSLLLAFNHPPTYLYTLALMVRLLGLSNESVRLVGILCFIISLFLIFGISQELFKGQKNRYLIALGACFLYSINPLAIQGSLLLDLDTTTLAVALLIFIYYFVKAHYLLNTTNLIFLGVFLSLALWTKLTTPPALILSIMLFYFIERGYKRGIYYAFIILFLGVSLFFISWWLYSYLMKIPFIFPLISLRERFLWMLFQGNFFRNVIIVFRTILKIILWVSPFFIFLSIIVISKQIKLFWQKRAASKIEFLTIYAFLVFIVYLITGRLNYSFPKYHFPIVSILSIMISAFFFSMKINFNRRIWLILCFSIPLLVVYNIFLIGDLLYSTDYTVKVSLITGSPSLKNVLLKEIVKFLFYILPFTAYFIGLSLLTPRASKLSKLVVSLLVMLISANLSLNILQAKSGYLTRYYYGDSGLKRVINFLNINVDPNSLILAPPEAVYYSDNNNPSYYYLRDVLRKMDDQEFIKTISNKKVVCIVYGICSQAVSHFTQVINRPSVQKALNSDFQITKIGSYTIWLRKDRGL